MVKSKLSIPFVLTFVFLVIVFGILFIHKYTIKNVEYYPHVRSIHVINLDKDVSRWENIQKTSQDIIKVERFPAVYGKELSSEEMYRQGIGFAITDNDIAIKNEEKSFFLYKLKYYLFQESSNEHYTYENCADHHQC